VGKKEKGKEKYIIANSIGARGKEGEKLASALYDDALKEEEKIVRIGAVARSSPKRSQKGGKGGKRRFFRFLGGRKEEEDHDTTGTLPCGLEMKGKRKEEKFCSSAFIPRRWGRGRKARRGHRA